MDELAAQRFVAPLGRMNHLAVQVLQVALHPLQRRARRSFERRIERRHRRDQARHLRLDRLLRLAERLLDRRRNLRLQQLVERRLVLRLQRLERQLVLGQETQRRGIEDRRGRARVEQRHRHAEVRVDAAQLAEVGELVRAGDVADGREQRVLHDRAEQDVGAEAGRLRRRLLDQRRRRVLLVADDEAAVLLADGAAAAVEVKQRDAVVVPVHLRVVAAGGEIRSGERRQFHRLPRHRELAREHLADQRLRRRVGGVVHDQPAVAEDLFQPAAERLRHAAPRRVGAAQAVDQRAAEFGRGQELLDLVEHGDNRLVQGDGGDGGGFGAGPRRQGDAARRQRFVEHRTRPDFLPVVVFGVDPEHRDRRHLVVARHLLGELDRGQRLEQREQRAAEQPGLLAGDDGDRLAVGEQRAGLARARRRAAPLLLSGDDRGDFVAVPVVRLGPRDRVGPRGAVRRIAGKKRRYGSEIVRVVGREAADPGKPPDVDRNTHGRPVWG